MAFAGGMDASGLCRRQPRGPMSRAPGSHRLFALLGALGLIVAVTAPAAAADPSPGTDTRLRPDRPAWDEPARDTASDQGATQLLIRFRPGTTAGKRLAATSVRGVRRLADRPASRLALVETTDVTAATAALKADPAVLRVTVNHRYVRDLDPADETYFEELWGLHNTGQQLFLGEDGTEGLPDADIDGLQALNLTTGDPNVVVAVIDDGVDFDHPDLAAQAWTNPGESGGGKETNGVDDDGNGFEDDVNGWDFCNDDNTVHDFDEDSHGTHVAGTIAASLNGAGVVGVAPSVRIMALKFIDDSPFCGADFQAIAAIEYAESFGVHIVNASWGRRGDPDEPSALHDTMADASILFVVSAGNSGIDNDHNATPALPATYDLPNIVSVAAVDNSSGIPEFSNYGATTVDIAAPGVAILSTLPADSSHPQPGYGWMSGTSMAAPHATGVAALIASQYTEPRRGPGRDACAPARDRQVDAGDRRLDGHRADRRCVSRARHDGPDRPAAIGGVHQGLDPRLDEGLDPNRLAGRDRRPDRDQRVWRGSQDRRRCLGDVRQQHRPRGTPIACSSSGTPTRSASGPATAPGTGDRRPPARSSLRSSTRRRARA